LCFLGDNSVHSNRDDVTCVCNTENEESDGPKHQRPGGVESTELWECNEKVGWNGIGFIKH
jgi:hypothetical protein